MNKLNTISISAEEHFGEFLNSLKKGKDGEWQWLVSHLRERAVPWIRKRDGNLPQGTIVSESYFVEEVFAESLIKFYELFQTGTFKSLADLRGLIFRIAEFKMKEGYRAVKKDKAVFFPEFYQKISEDLEAEDFTEQIKQEQKLVQELEKQLSSLPNEEQEILKRYSKGEKLKKISEDLGLKEETGRKKKQRALSKLRENLYNALKLVSN